MLTRKRLFGFILVLLVFGVLFQSWQLFFSVWDDMRTVRATMGQRALWRSANFRISQRFADYTLFLNANIPDDGRVVLPPGEGGPKVLGITPFMQFFLVPRQVINCIDLNCLRNVDRQNTYIPFASRSLVNELTLDPDQILFFDEEWGLILPVDASPGDRSVLLGFESFSIIANSFLAPSIWVLILTISGSLILEPLLPSWPFTQKVAFGYGLGTLIFTLSVSMTSLVGFRLSRYTIIWVTLILFICAIGFYLYARNISRQDDLENSDSLSARLSIDPWVVMFFLLGMAAMLISVGKSYHTTDAIQIWGVKGYGIAATGVLTEVMSWGTNTVHYPLHVPVLIAGFRLLSGDILPASKMLFSAYYLVLLLLIYHALLSFKLRKAIAGLGTLLVGTAPLIFRHATIGYANLALTYYLVAAIFMLTKSFEAAGRRESFYLSMLSGVFFGAAAWTRAEGLLLSLICIVLLLGITYIRHRLMARQVVVVLAPMVVYGVFWILVKALVYRRPAANSALVLTAVRQIFAGDFHLEDTGFILRSTLFNLSDISTWGLLGMAIFLVLIFSVIILTRRRDSTPLSLWVGLLLLILILGIYYLTSYDTEHDISWWVSTGLNRLLLPAVVMLWVGGISSLQLLDDYEHSSVSANTE